MLQIHVYFVQKKVVGPNWYFFEAQRTVQQKERWECVMNLVVFRISNLKTEESWNQKAVFPTQVERHVNLPKRRWAKVDLFASVVILQTFNWFCHEILKWILKHSYKDESDGIKSSSCGKSLHIRKQFECTKYFSWTLATWALP